VAFLYTQAEITAQLTAWKAAELAVASGQSYTISEGGDSYTVTRADAAMITDKLDYWARVQADFDRANNRTTDGKMKNPLGFSVGSFS